MIKKILAAALLFASMVIAIALCAYGFVIHPPSRVVWGIIALVLAMSPLQTRLVRYLGWEIRKKPRKRSVLEERAGIPE